MTNTGNTVRCAVCGTATAGVEISITPAGKRRSHYLPHPMPHENPETRKPCNGAFRPGEVV